MKSLRLIFALVLMVLVTGVALWCFRSKPAAPLAAPVAQKSISAPAAEPVAETGNETSVPPKSASVAAAPSTGTPAPMTANPATPVSQVAGGASPDTVISSERPQYAPPEPPKPNPENKLVSGQVATARMYAAHASLRTPEVADPDSTANKQILSTMVAKALSQTLSPSNGSQPATPPPALPAKR